MRRCLRVVYWAKLVMHMVGICFGVYIYALGIKGYSQLINECKKELDK